MAKVDILLPYWGDFELLKRAVDSVLAQTEKDWSLLIIDDCYPSQDAANYYSSPSDKRIKFSRHKKNLGLVGNYNYAIDKATSEYCVMMGCDDVMKPNYLERALSKIGETDYYHPGVDVIDDNDRSYLPLVDKIKRVLRPKRSRIYAGEAIVASLCTGNWLYFPAIMWRTSVLKKYGFDPSRPNTQDLLVAVEILVNNGSMYLDNKVTFNYRRSASSFSSRAKQGTRFAEERALFTQLSRKFWVIGWKRAAIAARLHLTVRIHRFMNRF